MERLARLLWVLTIPIVVLNLAGGVVAGIWLAIVGQWRLLLMGIAAGIVADFGIGFAMMPNLLLAAPAVALLKRGYRSGYALALMGQVYVGAVLAVWCVAVLHLLTRGAAGNVMLPCLLWSYSAATGPVAHMARRELMGGNEYAMIHAFFLQIAYLLVILATLLVGFGLRGAATLFGGVMLLSAAVVWLTMIFEDKARAEPWE